VASITISRGPGAGERVELGDELTIGREGTDLVLDDRESSRRHAVIRVRGGTIEIEDLGSLNGTWVDGSRIERVTTLYDGARLRIGESELTVAIPTGTSAGATRVAADPRGPRAVAVPPPPPPPVPAAPPVRVAPAAAVPTPFAPPSPPRRRTVATRLWVPAAFCFATIGATAIALIAYFASR
jgi:pSer/pThr/pTyr-binding forkhead associated (FHA) protein